VLVVEDEEAVRQFAARVLEAKGYRVLQARSAEEAIRACESHTAPLELVVTDLVLPGGGGSELVGRLAQLQPGLRALYISGYPQRAALHQGQLPREADFLGKPFRAAALAAKVREILDRRPA